MRSRRGGAVLVALAFLGCASLGLPDGAIGVAWPRIRESFGLPLDALGALLAATVSGYVAASFLAGALLARINVGALFAGRVAFGFTRIAGAPTRRSRLRSPAVRSPRSRSRSTSAAPRTSSQLPCWAPPPLRSSPR